jgi:hypothetical protein
VKQAIESRDLTPVVDMLGPAAYDDLRVDVAGLVARGAIQHYDGLVPAEVSVAAAQRGSQGDAITLRITATAIQGLIPEDREMELSPSTYSSFTEIWTFSRPPDSGTLPPERLECPTCGAPIDIDTGRICRYCRTLLPPPRAQSGWTVVAIKPAQENLG